MKIVTEQEFSERIALMLTGINAGSVTGPGRSGAIASVYASHLLSIPFIPYGNTMPNSLGKVLIIDTATKSGRTLRKADRKYKDYDTIIMAIYNEPPRVAFWYETTKLTK